MSVVTKVEVWKDDGVTNSLEYEGVERRVRLRPGVLGFVVKPLGYAEPEALSGDRGEGLPVFFKKHGNYTVPVYVDHVGSPVDELKKIATLGTDCSPADDPESFYRGQLQKAIGIAARAS